MKIIKLVPILILSLGMLAFGCAKQPVDWSTVDTDGDGLPNGNEVQNNQNTCDIKCPLKNADGSYVKNTAGDVQFSCKDCVTTADCGCKGIGDSESHEATANCGWKCVSKNARTWIMVGGGLLAGFVVGEAFQVDLWPFNHDKKDVNDEPIEEIAVNSITWEKSDMIFENIGGKQFMRMHIEGTCYDTATSIALAFDCTLDLRNQVDEYPTVEASNEIAGWMKYSFNLDSSPVKGKVEQHITVYDGRTKTTGYVKDPAWLGFQVSGIGYNKSYLRLWDKQGATYFNKLSFNQTSPINFQWGPNSYTPGNSLFYEWSRIP